MGCHLRGSSVVFMLFFTALMTSCEHSQTDSLKLTNNTSQTVYFLAMTVEISTLIDLNPIIPLESDDRRKSIIAPCSTTDIDADQIMGYNSGDDIQFYFYEVISDTAYYSGGLQLTHKKLQELKFHVVFDDEQFERRKVK